MRAVGSPAGAREALPALAQGAQVGQLHPGCLPMPHEAEARQLLCSKTLVRTRLAVAPLGGSLITHTRSEAVSGAVNPSARIRQDGAIAHHLPQLLRTLPAGPAQLPCSMMKFFPFHSLSLGHWLPRFWLACLIHPPTDDGSALSSM